MNKHISTSRSDELILLELNWSFAEVMPGCMESLLTSYSRGPQLLSLEHNGYNADSFQQGLTPPQMPGDHMNPYG